MKDEIPLDLTLQMGRCVLYAMLLPIVYPLPSRPVSQGAGEIRGFVERAEYMLSIAESQLADVQLTDTDKPGFRRFIKRVPLGVVFVIAPWKYVSLPCLDSISSILSAQLPVSNIDQLCPPRPHRRQQCPPQTVTTDSRYG